MANIRIELGTDGEPILMTDGELILTCSCGTVIEILAGLTHYECMLCSLRIKVEFSREEG